MLLSNSSYIYLKVLFGFNQSLAKLLCIITISIIVLDCEKSMAGVPRLNIFLFFLLTKLLLKTRIIHFVNSLNAL